jgi:hypothetical protein
MNSAIDVEHRSRLGCKICPRPHGKKTLRSEHAGLLATDIKNAIRLNMKVAGSFGGICPLERLAVLDIEADRR